MRVDVRSLSPAASAAVRPKSAPAPAARPSDLSPASPAVVATAELVLVGQRVDAALPLVERAINDALLSGKGALRLVHGHGTGRLAAAVREFLTTHPGVASFRYADAAEGGPAVTIARLDV